jgi:hypothetical protein
MKLKFNEAAKKINPQLVFEIESKHNSAINLNNENTFSFAPTDERSPCLIPNEFIQKNKLIPDTLEFKSKGSNGTVFTIKNTDGESLIIKFGATPNEMLCNGIAHDILPANVANSVDFTFGKTVSEDSESMTGISLQKKAHGKEVAEIIFNPNTTAEEYLAVVIPYIQSYYKLIENGIQHNDYHTKNCKFDGKKLKIFD